MAKVTYDRGIQCKNCGDISIRIPRFSRCFLCQNCGAHLADIDHEHKEVDLTQHADIVTVKVTHKIFTETYEIVPNK